MQSLKIYTYVKERTCRIPAAVILSCNVVLADEEKHFIEALECIYVIVLVFGLAVFLARDVGWIHKKDWQTTGLSGNDFFVCVVHTLHLFQRLYKKRVLTDSILFIKSNS